MQNSISTLNPHSVSPAPSAIQTAKQGWSDPALIYETREVVLAARSKGGDTSLPGETLYVDRDGEVIVGSDTHGDTRGLSSVAGDTFYATRNLAQEETFVRTKMPRNTIRTRSGDFDGYAYTITNRLGDSYSLFLYWSSSYGCYRVSLVAPRMGGLMDVHGGHLYPDNTLCLTRRSGSGYPSIEQTYAKAGLWTLGASLFRRGYGFQFNTGQDGVHRA